MRPAQLVLGDAESGYAGFSLPIIELSDGTQINPAAVDLSQWQALAIEALSPCEAACMKFSCLHAIGWRHADERQPAAGSAPPQL